MRDRNRDERRKGGSPKGGAGRRGGYGDDQGTRIGSPDPSGREAKGPSSQTTGEGLEGSVLEGEGERTGKGDNEKREGEGEKKGTGQQPRTGAGAEAARSIHAFGSGHPDREDDAAEGHGGNDLPEAEDRPGSEPLRGTHRQHESGYGGRGDQPKRSSDEREPLDYEGSGGEEG